MADVFTLLTLPRTSNGLTALRETLIESDDDGSPPRKAPRAALETYSPGSAARAKRNLTERNHGPINIQIVGNYIKSEANNTTSGDSDFPLVRQCIRIILTREAGNLLPATYERIYAGCRSIVHVSNKGEGLYDALKLELEQCAGRLADDLLRELKTDMKWLSNFVEICTWFEKQVGRLHSLLTYLDQEYVLKNPRVVKVRALAFSIFGNRIFQNAQITECLQESVKEWLIYEREYRLSANLRGTIPMLVAHLNTHGQYSAFEENYLHCTQTFYEAESKERAEALKTQGDAKGFFKHVRQRIEEEETRSKEMLPVGSWAIVRKTTEQALLNGTSVWLADNALGPFMTAKDINSLQAMYKLFSRIDGLKTLCSAFKAHVQTEVQNIVKDPELDGEMVERLLALKSLADHTINFAFLDEVFTPATSKNGSTGESTSAPRPTRPNQEFVYALTDAFTTGFKRRRNKPAEMIAIYIDKAMRKGQQGATDAEFEAMLDGALGLYRYTDDKDVFRTFYHRALAKRLLLGRSASDDFEKAILKKLKDQFDPEFGMGEEMFKDLALSRESMRDYHEKLDRDSPGQNLNVMVLQQSAWPFSPPKTSSDLPPKMQSELTAYTEFYKTKHQGHKLTWDHSLGTVTMKARFTAGSKELSLSLYQALVLLLFNDTDELRYMDILEETRMDEGELQRTLQSLACGKKKVLKKVPVGRDVHTTDVFQFNYGFTDPRAKLHINSIQAKVSPEESKRTQTSIEGDRKHYLDAAIVRVMKARKELPYAQLSMATIDAVKSHFVPAVDMIKARIDSLVEQEYLRRDEEDRSLFIYVA